MLFSIIFVSTIITILMLFPTKIAKIFTDDSSIIEYYNSSIIYLCIFIFFDTIHGVLSGIIRGIGVQKEGSIFTLFCYYIFGLPLSYYFGFNLKMNLKGLWLGFFIATLILDIGYTCIIGCSKWN